MQYGYSRLYSAAGRYTAADKAAEVAVEMAPGDCVIHHCNVIHRADKNLSPSMERRALAARRRAASSIGRTRNTWHGRLRSRASPVAAHP
jgi:ectoine hydroxylase-related dioxygenase (phytanoyl-CoA dioxygenase family)